MSYGNDIGKAFVMMCIVAFIIGGMVFIGLWELVQWLYHNLSITIN